MADLQSFIQSLYPDRSPDEPQIMTPESAANRQTGRTQAEVDQSFPLLLRAMAAAQQHMVPPMGTGNALPIAQGARRFAPGERPLNRVPPPAPPSPGYGVKAGDMVGPERLQMLAQHYTKHPHDWTMIGSGTQGDVFRPPDQILDFLGLPPLTAKVAEPYTTQREAQALRALPNLQGQDLQKRYVGTVLQAGQDMRHLPNRIDPANPQRAFSPSVFKQGWLFTREVPKSEKANPDNNMISMDQPIDWDQMKTIASEATRQGVRLGGDSFSSGNLWLDQQGKPRLMDSGYSSINHDMPKPLHNDNLGTLELDNRSLRRLPIPPRPPLDPALTIDRDLLQ